MCVADLTYLVVNELLVNREKFRCMTLWRIMVLCFNELHHLEDLVLELDMLVLQAVNCACRRLSKGS